MLKGSMCRADWVVDHTELRGVFVGGCVERGVGSRFRAKAHAHTSGGHRGWICFLSSRWLGERLIWLHELAHVVTREGHTRRWREFLLQIGGTLDEVPGVLRSYHPVSRRPVSITENSNGIHVTSPNGGVTTYPVGSAGYERARARLMKGASA